MRIQNSARYGKVHIEERAFTRSRERVYACAGKTVVGRTVVIQAGSASDERPPTRFTTLSCNYHHKVDFTSSKSPRKGMLHFARAPASALPLPQRQTTPSFDHPGATTSPTENHLGRLSVLPPFESLPATSPLSLPLSKRTLYPRMLKPAESCPLPSVRQSHRCKDREPRAG